MVNSIDLVIKEFPQFSKIVVKCFIKKKDFFTDIISIGRDDNIILLFQLISSKIAIILDKQFEVKEELMNGIFILLEDLFKNFFETLKSDYLVVIIKC